MARKKSPVLTVKIHHEWQRCDFKPEHGANDRPQGPQCGSPATHRIVWLDGSGRFSFGCDAHLDLDPEATPHRIERLGARPRSRAQGRLPA